MGSLIFIIISLPLFNGISFFSQLVCPKYSATVIEVMQTFSHCSECKLICRIARGTTNKVFFIVLFILDKIIYQACNLLSKVITLKKAFAHSF